MAKPLNISHDNPDLYDVYIMDEVPLLVNCLKALVQFRRKFGSKWPSQVNVHYSSRLNHSFGDGIEIVRQKWSLVDAFYMHLYDPIVEEYPKKRTPRVLKVKRSAA